MSRFANFPELTGKEDCLYEIGTFGHRVEEEYAAMETNPLDYVSSEYEDGWVVETSDPLNINRLIVVKGPFPTERDAEQWIKEYEAEQVAQREKEVEGTVLPTWNSALREVHGNFRLGFCPQIEAEIHSDRRRADGRRAPMPALSRED